MSFRTQQAQRRQAFFFFFVPSIAARIETITISKCGIAKKNRRSQWNEKVGRQQQHQISTSSSTSIFEVGRQSFFLPLTAVTEGGRTGGMGNLEKMSPPGQGAGRQLRQELKSRKILSTLASPRSHTTFNFAVESWSELDHRAPTNYYYYYSQK